MVVLDDTTCMVDIARFFLDFTQKESCGKCTFCRIGTKRMLETLERITTGEGEPEDIEHLKHAAEQIKQASLCGLGQTAPNPVLTTIKYYEDEYIAHITDKKCPAASCSALVAYMIDPEKCTGCTVCARNCPVDAIYGGKKEAHTVDQDKCVKCGKCITSCNFDAVYKA
jgi:NADH-quinone oxidoreductase subunit F